MARGSKQKKEKEPKDEEFFDDEEVEQEDDGPPSIDPYEVLELEADCTADDVKKSYRKLALKYHPDKASEADKPTATQKFQEVAFAYAVLSDATRRKRYDLSGSTAETVADDDDFDWLSFYRQQYDDLVTEESIKRVASDYKESEEERQDILKAYKSSKGSFGHIYASVMLSDIQEDDDRFRAILNEEIAKGTIQSYPKFEKENTDEARAKAKAKDRKRREDFDKVHGEDYAEKTKAKAKGKAKKSGGGDMSDLAALIQQRQKARAGNFLDNLADKYGPRSNGKKRATPMDDEPPEEAFQAMGARKKSKSSKSKERADEELEADLDEEDVWDSEEEEEQKPKPRKKGKLRQGRAKAKA
ncbi:DnaJ-domain-containing protein [Amniculicola lignicola CBS 123094]|uniref:DnaJ-domain-containing protein n=1 Tax=Amniculicola lignicola CBS 123094 TaxID=1392246 RepID=A0A6A5WPH7_9PLEO|nr:DnaJ-domain-containing protein [Amniculicola lignicola CBS 123094]